MVETNNLVGFKIRADIYMDHENIPSYNNNKSMAGIQILVLHGIIQPLTNKGQEEIFPRGRLSHNYPLQGFLQV